MKARHACLPRANCPVISPLAAMPLSGATGSGASMTAGPGSTRVVAHDPDWAADFAAEAERIRAAFAAIDIVLHHIGSTSVPGLAAKPIIDMLGVVRQPEAADGVDMAALGYRAMGEFGLAGRRYFRKDDASGRRTHHLHVFGKGSPHVERHLVFRDYLRAHPQAAHDYGALKLRISAGGAIGWDAYQDAKDAFVRQLEAIAPGWTRQGH